MKCPACNMDLQMTERSGVEIDYCPQCRGVWLDRGELDKIIERSVAPHRAGSDQDDDDYRSRKKYHDTWDYDDDYRDPGKQRRGWFGELFDFGD